MHCVRYVLKDHEPTQDHGIGQNRIICCGELCGGSTALVRCHVRQSVAFAPIRLTETIVLIGALRSPLGTPAWSPGKESLAEVMPRTFAPFSEGFLEPPEKCPHMCSHLVGCMAWYNLRPGVRCTGVSAAIFRGFTKHCMVSRLIWCSLSNTKLLGLWLRLSFSN